MWETRNSTIDYFGLLGKWAVKHTKLIINIQNSPSFFILQSTLWKKRSHPRTSHCMYIKNNSKFFQPSVFNFWCVTLQWQTRCVDWRLRTQKWSWTEMMIIYLSSSVMKGKGDFARRVKGEGDSKGWMGFKTSGFCTHTYNICLISVGGIRKWGGEKLMWNGVQPCLGREATCQPLLM